MRSSAENGRSPDLLRGSFPIVRIGTSTVIRLAILVGALLVLALLAPMWLPLFGTALAVDEPPAPADAALVLEGTGADATGAAEAFRLQGLVRDVVVVEAPVKTHALTAYWSDFVRWGLARPAETPADHLAIVRAPSTQAGQQALAALPALQADAARNVLVMGGGGIGSRLVERQLSDILAAHDIRVHMVRYGEPTREPANWYRNAEDRRAVLDSWLQLLVPFLSGYDETGT